MPKDNIVQFPLWVKEFNETVQERFEQMDEISLFETCIRMHEQAKEQYPNMSLREKREFEKQDEIIQSQMKKILGLMEGNEPY